MINKLLIVGILVLGCAAAGADEDRDKTYRWEDGKGNVYYSDLPPPAGARNISTARESSEAPTPELPYELQLAVKKFPVTIYVTPDCGGPCDSGSALLIGRGVPHTVLDAMKRDVNQKLNALTNGQPAVPVAEIGKIVVQGFEQGRWNAALDQAGYPRDALISVRPYFPAANDVGEGDDSDGDDSDDDGSDDDDSDDVDAGEFDAGEFDAADDEAQFDDE
jgi:hypothetical protein